MFTADYTDCADWILGFREPVLDLNQIFYLDGSMSF